MKEDEMPDFIKQFDPDTVDLNVDRQSSIGSIYESKPFQLGIHAA